ncbi:MAG: rhomboid family intramembrane serine protease [Fibrobacter sp.]|nr:rhomboid family intramembrane serine protease [Fibrobacter sp.]
MKPFRYLPKVLQILLLANAAVFVIAFLGRGLEVNLGAGYGSLTDYISYFGAFMPRVPLELWRYVTYMFIHVDFMHFFFNMLMLWMFGSEVAEWMGTRHFVSMYFFCGIFAALFSFFMCLLGLTNNPIIGASGALMGIFVAYYKFFPERMLLMFFIIPMKIKHAMWVMIALDIFFANSGDMIAHFAHLGGVVAGFLYMALYQNSSNGSLLSGFSRLFSRKTEKFSGRSSGRRSDENDTAEPEVLEGEVFYVDEQKRMDDILRKVEREGIQSLTESEREFLLRAGDKLRCRRGGM